MFYPILNPYDINKVLPICAKGIRYRRLRVAIYGLEENQMLIYGER